MIKHLPPQLKANARRYGILVFLFIIGTVGAFALGDAYVDAGLPAPTVTSDKDDYSPGQIAHITGSGWTLDQKVHVELKEYPDYPDYHVYDVAVDANGNWKIDYQVEERHLGVTFTVTAKGSQSGTTATTIFTDAGFKSNSVIVSGSSFCVGQTPVNVNFEAVAAGGAFDNGNVFTAQLSNSSGDFSSPIDIGTLPSKTTGTSLKIEATIPLSTPPGKAYKIRVVSSNPYIIGPENGIPLTISALPTTANAGVDQLSLSGTSTTLSGNTPSVGAGTWSIVSGTGGSFGSTTPTTSTSTNPTATFNGTAGETYILRWTITNGECSSSREVKISFSSTTSTITSVASASTTYGNTSVLLSATVSPKPSGGNVQFYVNDVAVGSSVALEISTGTTGTATYNYNPSALNASSASVSHTISAKYLGSGSFTASPISSNGTLT
ncbi:Ig-like domain-containing protein, partial [Adhaeribacter aerolatus]|uniref:Ig-like domain-containing protein n=1 Tax=Adhaeribacter aerolatus TaxID=670289 RepID=UPI0011BF133A